MIKIIVTGACGRMGKRIVEMVVEQEDMELAGVVEKEKHPFLGRDMGEILGRGKTGVLLQDDLKKVVSKGGVVIDFTYPEATLSHLKLSGEYHKAMVIGTTGFTEEEILGIEGLAENIPCVFSPNMSVGVNLLFKIAAQAAKTLGDDYNIEIIEAHHCHKKDAPSGTARKLAEILAEAREQSLEKVAVYGRQGITGERPKESIGIHAIRGGDIVGDHTVVFAGPAERIELTHRAHSRDTFARGAIRAARFLATAPPGLYSMQDVL
ncbi:4-hydroxy-tetrahydrodipicolinate reductase [candidate division NPL-UPA2 bacterium]|nr:4-hydroxy-tetrahydrodipicolinate reductase [candidate division NPL-UPA2 bacterium]